MYVCVSMRHTHTQPFCQKVTMMESDHHYRETIILFIETIFFQEQVFEKAFLLDMDTVSIKYKHSNHTWKKKSQQQLMFY